MENHKYSLEKYKGTASRHVCPKCEQKGKFALYIDNDTNQPLNKSVGRCERQDNCGYHYTPSEWFRDNPTEKPNRPYTPKVRTPAPQPPKEIGRIPKEHLINSLGYNSNFVVFLCSLFDRYTLESPSIESIMGNYCLGQGKNKEVIYWQIDGNKRIRTGKIMQYDNTVSIQIITHEIDGNAQSPEVCLLIEDTYGDHIVTFAPKQAQNLIKQISLMLDSI